MSFPIEPLALISKLQSNRFSLPLVLRGAVQSSNSDSSILFLHNAKGSTWSELSVEAIEGVQYIGLVRHCDVDYPYVEILVKDSMDPVALAVRRILQATLTESNILVQAAALPKATKRINLTFEATGNGTLECVGLGSFPCQGLSGVNYPPDVTVTINDKERVHHSIEFGVDMPFAIRIWPARGIYIHEWPFCNTSGGQSAGCVHLCNPSAETVYNWIDGNTRIVTSYPW